MNPEITTCTYFDEALIVLWIHLGMVEFGSRNQEQERTSYVFNKNVIERASIYIKIMNEDKIIRTKI